MELFLNGEFLAEAVARISPLDRGFLFADGVYEVIPVYSRQPFRLQQHLDRLDASLASVRLANPYDRQRWCDIVAELVARTPFDDQSLYLQITRGPGVDRDFPFPEPSTPTALLFAQPLQVVAAALKASGVRALSAPDIRWLRCDVKSLQLIPTVLYRQAAKEAGCAETVMFRDGYLSEGAASNIFAVRDGVLLAPPKNNLLLPGITYDLVLELAAAHQVPAEIRPISEAETRSADELWMTSSTREVLAIVELDGQAVGSGRVGPLAQRFDQYYQAFKADIMRKGLSQ